MTREYAAGAVLGAGFGLIGIGFGDGLAEMLSITAGLTLVYWADRCHRELSAEHLKGG